TCDVVGSWRGLAPRRLIPLRREELVGDTHLDVVGLTGKHQQRDVLSLPPESGDRAVVARAIEVTADSEVLLTAGIGRQVGIQGGVRDALQQSRSICRSRDTQSQVAASEVAVEIILNDVAVLSTARRIYSAAGDEQGVDTAVPRAA